MACTAAVNLSPSQTQSTLPVTLPHPSAASAELTCSGACRGLNWCLQQQTFLSMELTQMLSQCALWHACNSLPLWSMCFAGANRVKAPPVICTGSVPAPSLQIRKLQIQGSPISVARTPLAYPFPLFNQSTSCFPLAFTPVFLSIQAACLPPHCYNLCYNFIATIKRKNIFTLIKH